MAADDLTGRFIYRLAEPGIDLNQTKSAIGS